MLLSLLILSCDPDEAKKKPTTTNPQDQDKDDKNNQTNKPPEKIPATKLTRAKSTIPVVSLGAVGIDSGNPKDANNTVWVFQGDKITFSTTARDKDKNKIANAQFTWEWRKRDKKTESDFGRTWTEIPGQTTKTAQLTILADERVGAYELRVSATSGKKTVESEKPYYRFTVRKSKSSCPAPSTTNRPADLAALKAMVTGSSPSVTGEDLNAIDTSLIKDMAGLFDSDTSFNSDINCWDISNVTKMSDMFFLASKFKPKT